jgi:hypothetical protein
MPYITMKEFHFRRQHPLTIAIIEVNEIAELIQ